MQWKEVVDLPESFFLGSLRPRSLVSTQLFLERALEGILRRYSVYRLQEEPCIILKTEAVVVQRSGPRPVVQEPNLRVHRGSHCVEGLWLMSVYQIAHNCSDAY